MPTVKCRRKDCISWDGGICLRDSITIDEEEGCVNFQGLEDLLEDDDDLAWVEDEVEEDIDYFDEGDEWADDEEDEDPTFDEYGMHDDIEI